MERKLPYYMMYPVMSTFEGTYNKEMSRDYEYLKSMYPEMAQTILPYVEEECDRYEYEESMIYDEYPDKLQLRLMGRRIFDKVRTQEKKDWNEKSIRDIGDILLYQEILNRRERKRQGSKRIFW